MQAAETNLAMMRKIIKNDHALSTDADGHNISSHAFRMHAAKANNKSLITRRGLDRDQSQSSVPQESQGKTESDGKEMVFEVGYGKNGVGCIGSTFEEGVTPLGTFKVNAIMSKDRFEMDENLIQKSGKTRVILLKIYSTT